MSPTPAKISTRRMKTAPRMPQVRIFGWYFFGTPKYEKIMMNTNMLSIEREYSIT